MFIKIKVANNHKSNATDVIKQDKEIMRYKSILKILKNIRVFFRSSKKESATKK